MKIYSNNIPASHYSGATKLAQIIPEQTLTDIVDIPVEVIPYIKCEIQSTIQHESGHRSAETDFYENEGSMTFEDATSESHAEKEEENCNQLMPSEFGGEIISVNLNQLFEEAKTAANIPPTFKTDIRAGTLQPEAQGMYLMQNFDNAVGIKRQISPNQYEGFDGTLWIDVRKIAAPWIVNQRPEDGPQKAKPPTYQDDGMQADIPNVSQSAPTSTAIPATPFSPTVPSREVQ